MSNFLLTLVAFSAKVLPSSIKKVIYRLDPLSGMIRNQLNRVAPEGMNKTTVAAGELAGYQLLLDMSCEKDYWLGTYEPELQHAIREFVKPGSHVYDIGANIGYITILLADTVGEDGRVYAFEALPKNVHRLQENISINYLDKRVKIISSAIADRSGHMSFLVGPSGGMGKLDGSAGRQGLVYSESIEVLSLSLDDFIYKQNHIAPSFIKIDIEGGEVLAMKGMHQLLAEGCPVIFMELHGEEAARITWDTLSSFGYRICRMQPGYPQVQGVDDLDWKAYIVGLPGNG
jgi:FkbM family methyltransferase